MSGADLEHTKYTKNKNRKKGKKIVNKIIQSVWLKRWTKKSNISMSGNFNGRTIASCRFTWHDPEEKKKHQNTYKHKTERTKHTKLLIPLILRFFYAHCTTPLEMGKYSVAKLNKFYWISKWYEFVSAFQSSWT